MKVKKFLRPSGPRPAFTLLELVIALGLASIIILAASQVLSTSLRTSQALQGAISRQDDLAYGLDYFQDEVLRAEKVILGPGGQVYFYDWHPNEGDHHRYIGYFFKNKALKRGAYHSPQEAQSPQKIRTRQIMSNSKVIIEDVESGSIYLDGDLLVLEMDLGQETLRLVTAIRGRGDL